MNIFSSIERLERRWLLHASGFETIGADPVIADDDAAPFHLRLNAGGTTFVDSTGNTWDRDRIGRGGKKSRRVFDVRGSDDDPLFATCRTGKIIRYSIPLPAPGTYGLHLLFADPKFTLPGRRVFDVFAVDQPVLTNFDLAASGGGRSALARTFGVTSDDGVMHLALRATIGKAVISGVELFQGEGIPPATSAWQPAAPAPLPLFESQGAAVGDKL
jgi:hypothetical protein